MLKPKGRPPIIEKKDLEALCQLQCTYEEIAAFFGITKRAVEKAAQKPEYREVMDRGRNTGLISLRRAQFTAATGGNVTMQIWLGKQLLGQKDQLNSSHEGSIGIGDDSAREALRSKLTRALPRVAPADPDSDQLVN